MPLGFDLLSAGSLSAALKLFFRGGGSGYVWTKNQDGTQGWAEPPTFSMGEVSFAGSATLTTITTKSTWTKAAGTTALSMGMNFDSPSAGRLRYIGKRTLEMHCGATISVKGAAASDVLKALIYKNGTVNGSNEYTAGTALTAGTITIKLGAGGDISSTAIHVMTEMVTNDYLEVAIQNDTDTDDFTVVDLNLFALGAR